ncbi:DUF1289 domain-containing protein [Pseudoroseicyclus aestuarii]|uniref:Fe-S protein YdhL (DUF1289 family) n=1 Tax=Pseudoroseicyclus aestuarii TaxID=1795041 RepID=A0A318SVG1_9RHOB|nr:DUF1289 domain-containing protein [Pseudoroseicyclus aestuarii]PYE83847.1 hypothetical protein DFP88_103208 [Pseudoroseicyclus aestuarii]
MAKIPSPCIGVCKFRREGHCIGCSMTKAQKKLAKSIKKPDQQDAFLTLVMHQQNDLGRYTHWREAYAKRCAKKGRKLPEALKAALARPVEGERAKPATSAE